jgi:hypothetical protein
VEASIICFIFVINISGERDIIIRYMYCVVLHKHRHPSVVLHYIPYKHVLCIVILFIGSIAMIRSYNYVMKQVCLLYIISLLPIPEIIIIII